MFETRGSFSIAVIALCVMYVVVRLWRLSDSCLWFDEIFSVHAAEHDWSSLFWFVAQDLIHPPLFYLLLKWWIAVGGESVFWLRLLPVAFSTLALFPFIQLCRELKLKNAPILVALALIAVNGSLIKYAQEVRMYSLLLCLSLFSIWIFTRFFFRGKYIWTLTLVNILLIYTHYFGCFIVLSEIAAIAILQRIKIRQVLGMFGINVVAFLPWVITLMRTSRDGAEVSQNIGWIEQPGARSILDLVFDLIEPFYYQQSSADVSTVIWITSPLLASFVAAILIYLSNWKQVEDKQRIYMLSIFAFLPVLFAFAISLLSPYSIWGSRHLITMFAPLLILTAICLSEIAVMWIINVLISSVLMIIFAISAFSFVRANERKFVWCEFENATMHIQNDGGGPIYAFEDLAAYHLWFALKERIKVVRIRDFPEMTEDTAYFLPRGFDDVLLSTPDQLNGKTIWIVYRAKEFDISHQPLKRLLEQNFKIVEQRAFKADNQQSVFAVRLEK